jgi:hypothetical protein
MAGYRIGVSVRGDSDGAIVENSDLASVVLKGDFPTVAVGEQGVHRIGIYEVVERRALRGFRIGKGGDGFDHRDTGCLFLVKGNPDRVRAVGRYHCRCYWSTTEKDADVLKSAASEQGAAIIATIRRATRRHLVAKTHMIDKEYIVTEIRSYQQLSTETVSFQGGTDEGKRRCGVRRGGREGAVPTDAASVAWLR